MLPLEEKWDEILTAHADSCARVIWIRKKREVSRRCRHRFAMTDIGRVRVVNQDYVYASDLPVGNLPNLYIVADGMGGHKAGDLASSYAVQTIVEAVQRSTESRRH